MGYVYATTGKQTHHLVHFTQGEKKIINRVYVFSCTWIHFTMGTCLQMLEIKTFFMDHQIHYNATL